MHFGMLPSRDEFAMAGAPTAHATRMADALPGARQKWPSLHSCDDAATC